MSLFDYLLPSLWQVLAPNLWWILSLFAVLAIITFPMPGRGPNSTGRDPWRVFKYEARRTVMVRAGYRCEAAEFITWGRCRSEAIEVDHVFPHSRGGPTVVSNGQAMCRSHNRAKAATPPPWWYIRGLERRRRAYYPADADVRMFAVLDARAVAARAR